MLVVYLDTEMGPGEQSSAVQEMAQKKLEPRGSSFGKTVQEIDTPSYTYG